MSNERTALHACARAANMRRNPRDAENFHLCADFFADVLVVRCDVDIEVFQDIPPSIAPIAHSG